MQRFLIILGLVILLVGLLWPWLSKLPLGRLPGDFVIRRDGFTLYFPLATGLLVSLILTLLLWLFRR
ncbi:DUF2905 domain-containing protein [Thioalkalivibrio sp. XN8]|uniref:DUF2905 domain-containing protein n=1 Tax=Thioalkalivibrio sp. XN8 TaxID=2712863 RepID=UPI0013EAADB4|nr:DUF2905 domain-containing protein [Thioalkalivibrio sp. XN8]NGP53209.1 DUF2905 domain-containing protein [Thioalkalivibrio sp. XN8]